jgi:hypothetical protein
MFPLQQNFYISRTPAGINFCESITEATLKKSASSIQLQLGIRLSWI